MPPEFHLQFGAGIHTGDAVLGLIGTERRWDYTAIGDSVNTAKRIQENAGPGQILISQASLQSVEDCVLTRPIDPIHAKGKREPVVVFEVLGLRE
jgi:adenylate cyclase